MLVVLFIFACSGISEAEVQSEEPMQEITKTAATIVTIEVEETEPDDNKSEQVKEAGSFEYYCEIIGEAAEEIGVEPALAIAISRLETGNFTSRAFTECNNFGGLTGANGVMQFASKADGLTAYIECLGWYDDKGLNTPRKMAQVYCPDNQEWQGLVETIMREHE